mgnify:CR=1 FL=1
MSILIVEDSKPMRTLIKRTLKQAGFGEHEVLEAEDGAEGLQLIRGAKPDLVLADWNMPQMNGLELLRALRFEDNQVKFGFVTSEQSEQMRADAADAGALFLIGKPFTAEGFNRELTKVFGVDDAAGTQTPLKEWLDCYVTSLKKVSENPLGFASCAEVNQYTLDIPKKAVGAYLPFEGGDDLFWLVLVSTEAGCQSLSRALFAMGPDEGELDIYEVGDAMGEIINIASGLVKSEMAVNKVCCTIGLPQFLGGVEEVWARKDRRGAEVRMGPVSAYACVVKVQ